MKYIYVVILVAFFGYGRASHIEKIVSTVPLERAFPIVSGQQGLVIYVDNEDFTGVRRAAGDLQSDLGKVTGLSVPIGQELQAYPIIVGTIGRSRIIDRLLGERKINAGDVVGR